MTGLFASFQRLMDHFDTVGRLPWTYLRLAAGFRLPLDRLSRSRRSDSAVPGPETKKKRPRIVSRAPQLLSGFYKWVLCVIGVSQSGAVRVQRRSRLCPADAGSSKGDWVTDPFTPRRPRLP